MARSELTLLAGCGYFGLARDQQKALCGGVFLESGKVLPRRRLVSLFHFRFPKRQSRFEEAPAAIKPGGFRAGAL